MMYTWLSEWEFKECSHSKDKDIDEVLQEVRKISPIYYVQERQIRKGFFKSKIETFYTLYEATGTKKIWKLGSKVQCEQKVIYLISYMA